MANQADKVIIIDFACPSCKAATMHPTPGVADIEGKREHTCRSCLHSVLLELPPYPRVIGLIEGLSG